MDKKARKQLPYALYMAAMAIWCALIVAAPLLGMAKSPLAKPLYGAFAPTCHQLNSRSLCVFPSGSSVIGDCTESAELSYSKTSEVAVAGGTGYKLPVCARDLGIYFAMLIGGIALPFFWKIESENIPNKWLLVVALIPIAIDGGTQIIGMRESTNSLRLWTGAIAGFALPFYIVPMANWAARKIGF